MAYGQKKKFGGGGGGGGKGRFNLDNYVEVKDRIADFVKEFPNGSIQTFISVHDGPEVVMEARVFRSPEDVAIGAYTSGFAREVEGKGNAMINGTSHLENCFHADTEILTNQGWQSIRQLCERADPTILVASFNEITGVIRFAAPLGYVTRDNPKVFLLIEDNLTKQIVTLDHRVLAGDQFVTASDLLANDTRAEPEFGRIPHTGILNGRQGLFPSVAHAQFRQWVIADGCVVEDQDLIRFGFKKQRKVERLQAVLQAADIPYTLSEPSSRGVVSIYVKGFGASKSLKTLTTAEVLQMSSAEASAFLEEIVHTDGTRHKRGGIYLRTTDRQYLESLCLLATTNRWEAGSLKFNDPPGSFQNGKPIHRVLLSSLITRRLNRRYEVLIAEEEAKAYCLTTVDGTVVTRMDGKTTMSGNCETSAVGRALANMGYGTTKNRASRSEMVKVARMETDHAEMIDWLGTYYSQIPEAATAVFDGEAHNLRDYIADNGDTIREEFKFCRVVVSAVEKALDLKWGE
jgi:hypothetical protein